jgi:sulfite exporter TauE/SafE
MPDSAALELTVVFLVGLLGSAHCVGMCGGFVVAVAHAGGRRRAALRQGAYFLGKTSTYAAFGALAGLAGGAAGLALSGFQGLLSLLLGLVLVGVGLRLCGALRRFAGPTRIGGRAAAVLGGGVRRLMASDRPGAVFGLGALNGLLPCGLVHGMLAKAATTGSAGAGALTLAVFGLGTVPALFAAGLFGALMPPARRRWLQRAGGVLVVALGALMLARSAVAFALLDPTLVPGGEALLCH